MFKPVLVAAASAVALMASQAAAQVVGIGTTAQGSFTFSAGQAIAKAAGSEGLQVRVQPHGGTSVYVPSVNNGEIQFGLANHLETTFALKGTAIYKDKQLPNLRVVTVMTPLLTGVYAKKDSGIVTAADLKGKRIPSEFATQRIIGTLFSAVLANGGLSYGDVEASPVPNVLSAADNFATGRLDAFLFAMGAGKVTETAAKVGGLTAIAISNDPDAVARMRQHVPVAYPLLVQPGKTTVGVEKPTYVMAYDYLVLTNKDVSDDTVYKLTKAMHGQRAAMVEAFPPMAGFAQDKMVKDLGVAQYHPGAVKFYTEKGMWPAKK